MKKSLLFSVALTAASCAFAASPMVELAEASSFRMGPKAPATTLSARTRAAGDMESYIFSYADAPYTALAYGSGGGKRIYLGFQMTADNIKAFAGSKVTGFIVLSPTDNDGVINTITEGRFFCTTNIRKEEYSQDFSMSATPFDLNTVAMETPYTITGDEKSLYFGYSIVTPENDDMYYAPIDYVPTSNKNSFLLGESQTGTSMPVTMGAYGSQYGALCMAIILENESFPNYLSFASMPATMCLPIGQASAVSVDLNATLTSPLESFEIEYKLGGKAYSFSQVLDPAMAPNPSYGFSVNIDFPAFTEKFNEDVEFKITKINGVENVSEGAVASSRVVIVDEMPVHQTLFEEYTGTWCAWCPRGFAALEYIRKNYPDFVVASYHNQDAMQVTTSYPSNISGYPSAVLNRTSEMDPYDGNGVYADMDVPIVGNILALNAVTTPWSVKVGHTWESENVLVANAQVANMAGFENKNYRIAYILVADGLSGKTGQWSQSNNYATYLPNYVEELNAFCRGGVYGKRTVTGLVFNDVVVSTTGIYGVTGSIPTSLEPEEKAEHSISFDLSKISANLIPDKNKLRVIAAVVDPSGRVLNCAKDEVNDFTSTGVEGIDSESAPVEYFNLNGQKVSNPSSGIFIRKQGSHASKVILK